MMFPAESFIMQSSGMPSGAEASAPDGLNVGRSLVGPIVARAERRAA